jgi:hypothetical protein
MVISYNQYLHFIVQCRKIQRQNYNSIHYIFDTIENSPNNMDMEIIAKVYTFRLYWRKNIFKLQINPCSMEMKSKQRSKICGLSKNKICDFSTTKYL